MADVDRLGMEQEFVKILGVDIPHITIPVRPGRDLARLIEVAAFQTKLKMSGYNPAKELNDRLIAQMAGRRPSLVELSGETAPLRLLVMSKPMSAKKLPRAAGF